MFYVFPRVVSKKECEKLLDYCIKNTEFKEAQVLNRGESDADISRIPSGMLEAYEQATKTKFSDRYGRLDPSIRKTDVAFVEADGNEGNTVNEVAWHYLNEANDLKFNYKFRIYQTVQFARYRDGGHYGWHRDVNESAISPNGESRKLSLTLCLTDPKDYEGGELQFFNGERPMDKKTIEDIRGQGSVIVFDSRDWHRVTPVTKGTRYSLVCWTVGPNFL